MNRRALLCLFAAFPVLNIGTTLARETDPSPVPPIPSYNQMAIPGQQPLLTGANGEAVWITHDHNSGKIIKRTWSPATGAHADTPLGLEGDAALAQTTTPSGILFLTTTLLNRATGKFSLGDVHAVLLTSDGKFVRAKMRQTFLQPRLVPLSDGSVAVLERDETTRHIRVDVVRLPARGASSVESMSTLTTPYRNDFQVAPLPNGRLMILGGSDAQYRGCSPCRAETQILDPKTKSWSAGPSMLEPRSEHLATHLPDGSILVTGGWTPAHGWGHGPSRSAERWNPTTNKFEAVAPMPSGTARHRAVWMPGQQGKILLIAGGTNSGIHAYDIRTGEWRTAGTTRQGSEEGGCAFVPFVFADNIYAWTINNSEGHYSSKSCGSQKEWELTALRSANASASPTPEKFLVAYRSGAALVPASGDQPMLVVGGSVHAGMNSYLATSAVEAIDTNGALYSLPSLNEARHGATALRVGEGVLVTGGRGEDSDKTARDFGGPLLSSAEWLASSTPGGVARWVRIPGITLPRVFEPLPNGNLLGFDDSANVGRFTFSRGAGGAPLLTAEANAYPPLNRARQSVGGAGDSGHSAVTLRALADGRVVVAGGQVQAEKIALYKPDIDRAGAGDEYIGIGPFLPSRRHEIYDPATKRWRTTAPSRGAGGKVAILPDGRVLKIGQLPGKDKGDSNGPYIMEISNAEGTVWTAWPTETLPKMKMSDKANPFVVDGELFLSGELGSLSTGGGPSGLEWFNAATGRWEALWWANPYDNWRDHQGRMIVRQLANGKKVVLPVSGY